LKEYITFYATEN